MVSYGPWTQDPDYDSVVLWEADDRRRTLVAMGWPTQSQGQFSEEEIVEDGPPFPTTPYEHMGDLLSNALVADDTPDPIGTLSSGQNLLSYNTSIILLDYAGGASAIASASIAPVVPGVPDVVAPQRWRPHTFYPEDEPDDAVDIEYEGDNPTGIPEWLAVEIDPTTTLTGIIHEEISGTYSLDQDAVSRTFTSEIRTDTSWPGPQNGTQVDVMETLPGDYTPVGSQHVRNLGHAVTLTPYVPAGDSGALVWIRTPDYVESSIPPDGSGGSWDWYYGWGFNGLRLRWTLRPPRYRWVYDTAPYRRTSPNDAAVEGARRNFPPSKAAQSGRRTSGGYL